MLETIFQKPSQQVTAKYKSQVDQKSSLPKKIKYFCPVTLIVYGVPNLYFKD